MRLEEAWQAYCREVMPPVDPHFTYPLEGVMYKVFCAGWDACKQSTKDGK